MTQLAEGSPPADGARARRKKRRGKPPAGRKSTRPQAPAKRRKAPTGTRPFAPFEWMIAFRYLRARRREAFISIVATLSFIGIMLGVATLIIVMSVMNGFRAELISRILGLNGHMIVEAMDSPLSDYDDVSARIAAVPGVTSVIPLVEGQALASGESASSGVLVRGLRDQDFPKVSAIYENLQLGSLDDFAEARGVAIGTRLAARLGLTLGSRLTLVQPRGNVTPLGVTPRIKAYPVNAIFEIGMAEFDATFVFMPFEEAQTYFSLDDEATAIEVYVDDPDEVGSMRLPVEEAAGRQILLTDWRQRNATFFSTLEVERNVMFIILTLIVLVAALNIISGLTMLVKEKGHDIAILRTIGATRGAVMRVFLITGAAIGTLGTIGGFVLGLVVALNIETIRQFVSRITSREIFSPEFYFLSQFRAEIDVGETVSVLVMALVLSFAATLYPAWRAARLDPVEALRYE